ncbi:DUF839 domain-containing protein [Methylobacterium organophilum]|nr:DUF839 domain-containing protein [Methylobacterium organophilum]
MDIGRLVSGLRELLPPSVQMQLQRFGFGDLDSMRERLASGALEGSQFLATKAFSFGQGTFQFLVSFFVMLYLLFFFIRDGRELVARIRQAIPSNPRTPNAYGHIIRWREASRDFAGTRFNWDLYLLAGPESDSRSPAGRALDGSNIMASPDGLWFDDEGRLWIQTDMSGSQLRTGPFGNNQMLVSDPRNGETRRFLVGPLGAEVTGITATPDFRTLFVNIQHPGEGSTSTNFTSSWPDGTGRRPRSATVIISREDGKRLM